MPPTDRQHVRHALVRFTRRRPSLFFPLAHTWQRLGYLRPVHLLTRDTDLVVEGFFRSANTYTAHAIQLASGDRLRIAYHSHAAATVIRAARWGVPTLVLARPPADAVLSNALKHPQVSMGASLQAYREFYQDVLPHRAHFVAATFKEATQDVNRIIARLNERFDVSFPALPTDASTRSALEQRLQPLHTNRPHFDAGKTDLPAPEKEDAKAKLRARLDEPELKPLLHQAQAVYEQFMAETQLHETVHH